MDTRFPEGRTRCGRTARRTAKSGSGVVACEGPTGYTQSGTWPQRPAADLPGFPHGTGLSGLPPPHGSWEHRSGGVCLQRWQGYAYAAVSSLGFATLGIFALYGLRAHLNVVTLLTWRFLIAGSLLSIWAVLTRQEWPGRTDFARLIAMGAIAYTVMSWLFLAANADAPVGLVSAVLYTYPALVTVLVAILGWERLSVARVLAVSGTFAGAALVALTGVMGKGHGSLILQGVALALTAAALYAGYITLGSVILSRVSGTVATAVVCLSAGVALGGIGVATGTLHLIPLQSWWIEGGLVLIATLVAILGFFRAIRMVGPGHAAIVSTVEPVGAALLGWMLFGQHLSALQLLGIVVVVASAGALRWEQPQEIGEHLEETAAKT